MNCNSDPLLGNLQPERQGDINQDQRQGGLRDYILLYICDVKAT